MQDACVEGDLLGTSSGHNGAYTLYIILGIILIKNINFTPEVVYFYRNMSIFAPVKV